MPEIDLNDLAEKGVIRDESAHQLVPEVWTHAENVHSADGAFVAMKGWEQIFGTPAIAPHFAMPLTTITQVFWPYVSLTAAAVWDGSSHTNITRLSGAYTATETRQWNGTLFGGIPIFNNNADVPQFWAQPTVATKLADLTNWPATGRAAVIRSMGAYLIAINYTEAGVNFPHMVKWSSEAQAPGTLPQSWDQADTAYDAGEYDLPDVNSGVLRDAMQLGSKMFLYKEQATWAMRFVGGQAIWSFDVFSDTSGILAPRCVAITGDGKKHVVATQDDIVIHDGSNNPVSIVHKKLRKFIFSEIDPTYYVNSFMFTDAENSEVVFCYPVAGTQHPTRALVFNYRNGALTECDVAYRNAVAGRVESTSTELWSEGTDTWDQDTGQWSTQERRKLVLLDPANTKFYKYNVGYTRNGVSYACTLRRTGLALVGRKRNGEWIVDHQVMKFVDRMWPKVTGGPIKIRVGTQMTVAGPVTWGSYFDFNPSTQVVADFTMSGRAVGVEFTTPTALDWRLDGYKISITADGNF